jgi:adenosylhomocysteine nucleosidase
VVLALARIGKVAAATTATTLIEAFDVQRILFTGVAGGLAEPVRVGDVVVASHFVQHDMDASPLFARFEVPLYQRTLFACDTRLGGLLLEASRSALAELAPAAEVHAGLIASGDRFVSQAGEAAALREALGGAGLRPLAVEMEGAAVAQVCHDYGLPFAAVRTVSDRADDEAAQDFQQFVRHVASRYATRIVARFLEALRE